MTGRRWHPDEDERLRQMVEAGAGIAALSEALNRTEDSIESRMRDNKLRLKNPHRGSQQAPNWTPADDAYLLSASERRVPLSVMAEQLGRTWQSVKRRLSALRAAAQPKDENAQVITRQCLACKVRFERKPGEHFFMCENHRNASASPFEPGGGGHTGRRAPAMRA